MALVLNSAAGEQYRKISVAVSRPVTHSTAEDDQSIVKDLCLFQSGHEVAELGCQEGFHDLKLADSIF